MQKTLFQNGSIIQPQFLNNIQEAPRFNSQLTRINFFSPSETNAQWEINQRDSIKDWELPDPSVEPYTSVGKLAHHGRVLGWSQLSESEPLNVTYGPPRLTNIDLDGITTLDTYHAIIETGSIIDTDFSVRTWERQLVSIGSNTVAYIYYDLDLDVVVASDQLPSRQIKFVPLAKLTVESSGQIIEYLDLRQSTYVDSLGFFSQRLNNTLYINSNSTLVSWQRAIVDTSNGSVILTVPDEDNSKDGDELALVDIAFSFNSRPVILRSSNSTSVNNTTEDWVIYNKGIYLELYYHEETKSWNFKIPPPNLEEQEAPVGTFLRCGGEVYLGIKVPQQCVNNSPSPDGDGVYSYNAETSQCYKKFYSDFAVYSDGQSGVYTEKAIRCGATKQEVIEWLNS